MRTAADAMKDIAVHKQRININRLAGLAEEVRRAGVECLIEAVRINDDEVQVTQAQAWFSPRSGLIATIEYAAQPELVSPN